MSPSTGAVGVSEVYLDAVLSWGRSGYLYAKAQGTLYIILAVSAAHRIAFDP